MGNSLAELGEDPVEGGAGLAEQRWDLHVPEAAFCNFRGFKVTQFYGAAF